MLNPKFAIICITLFAGLLNACNSLDNAGESELASSVDTFQNAISVLAIDTGSLPKGLAYKGIADTALHWSDKTGEYIALRTRKSGYTSDETAYSDTSNNIDLYVYCFKLNTISKNYERIWHIHDFVNDCQFDVVAEFFKDAFKLTDLNKNGIPEIWSVYRTACRSDISPCEMKIIMYEGGNKYAMRGTQKTTYDPNAPSSGTYIMDKSFQKADSSLSNYARSLWNEHLYEIINVIE